MYTKSEVVKYCVNRKRLFLLGLIFFGVMCISGIYALTNDMQETENILSTSAVEIELKEYSATNEPFSENGIVVMPGDEIDLIPRVNNLGIECYLRVKITYTIDYRVFNELDYVKGNYSSWQKKDGYYYYGSVFGRNESVEIFDKILIPRYTPDIFQDKKLRVNVKVDAVQEKNFDGNWNGVQILKSIDKNFDIDGSGSSIVIYEDDSENHVSTDEEFFNDLSGLLPGDSVLETITILNSSDETNNYYLKVENDLSDSEKKLLKNFKLIIKNSNGDTVVNSTLYDDTKHRIATFEPDEGDTFTIEVVLPKNANNEVSKLLTKIKWKFFMDDYTPEEEIPKTGDFRFDLSIMMFLISALGLFIVLVMERRYMKDEKKEGNKNYE